MKCCGSCKQHVGEVKEYRIEGWNCLWEYCEAAFEEDKRRGLKIFLNEDDDDTENKKE